MSQSFLNGIAAVLELNFNLAELLVIIVIISQILKVKEGNDFLAVIQWLVERMASPITVIWKKRPKHQIDPVLFVLLAILIPAQLVTVGWVRGII